MELPEFTFRYTDDNTGSAWLSALLQSSDTGSHFFEHPESIGDSLGLTDGPWHPLTPGHRGPVTAVCYWPEHELVATGGLDGRLLLWDAAKGRRQPGGGRAHGSPVSGIVRLPDGALVVACQGLMGLLRLAPGTSAAEVSPLWIPLRSFVTCLATAAQPDGILAGCSDGGVVQVGAGTEPNQRQIVRPGASRVDLLCPIRADRGLQLLLRRLGDSDGTIQVYALPAGRGGACLHHCLSDLDLRAGQSRPSRACPVARASSAPAVALLMLGCSTLGHLDLVAVDASGNVCASLQCHSCHTSRLSIVCPLTDSQSGGCCKISDSSILLATGAVNGEIKIWRAVLGGDAEITLHEVLVHRHSIEVTVLEFVHSRDGDQRLFIGDAQGSLTVVCVR